MPVGCPHCDAENQTGILFCIELQETLDGLTTFYVKRRCSL